MMRAISRATLGFSAMQTIMPYLVYLNAKVVQLSGKSKFISNFE